MKLWQLLRSHLGPYRKVLLIVVGLQSIATFAALTLPTINANLIDNGVLQGDNAYILQMGALMLFFSLVQIVFASGAVWFGARAALGLAATSAATCSTPSPGTRPRRSDSSGPPR